MANTGWIRGVDEEGEGKNYLYRGQGNKFLVCCCRQILSRPLSKHAAGDVSSKTAGRPDHDLVCLMQGESRRVRNKFRGFTPTA